jgi:hypothetical protein
MHLQFSYDKNKTIQGLRYHFFSRKEIKILLILVNVFALIAAILYYTHLIRPEPLLLGSFIWIMMMLSIWFILPYSIYRKSSTFKESFDMYISETDIRIDTNGGFVRWTWEKFNSYFESPNFFHLYFDEKTFFLIPKDTMTDEIKNDLRQVLSSKIG